MKINLPSNLAQICLKKLALYCTLSGGRELIPYLEVISMLRNTGGEQILKEHFKEEYVHVDRKLRRIAQINLPLSQFFLLVDNKKEFTQENYDKFIDALSEIYPYQPLLDECFIVMLSESNLKDEVIKNSYHRWAEGLELKRMGVEVKEQRFQQRSEETEGGD